MTYQKAMTTNPMENNNFNMRQTMLDRFWRKLERNWSIILSFLFMRMSTFDIFPAFNYQLTCFLASFTKWCIWTDLHLILCLKSEFYVALLESTRLFFLKNKTKQKNSLGSMLSFGYIDSPASCISRQIFAFPSPLLTGTTIHFIVKCAGVSSY